MTAQSLSAVQRYALFVFGICMIAWGVFSIYAQFTRDRTHAAVATRSQECQDDLKIQIASLQDYFAAKKAATESSAIDASTTAALNDKVKAIQAFKSRC